MVKKIMVIVIVLITVFALTACGTDMAMDALKNENRILKSENEILTERISELEIELNELSATTEFMLNELLAKTELMVYKLSAVAELKDYAAELNKGDYTDENWARIKDIVNVGKADIDEAIDKEEVDAALETAMAEVDEVEPKEEIDIEDLELRIRQDWLQYLHARGEKSFTLDMVRILRHYGIYGEAVVLKMNRGAYQEFWHLVVAGVDFWFEDSNTAVVWLDGRFYELEEAYEQGILSKLDLAMISKTQADFRAR